MFGDETLTAIEDGPNYCLSEETQFQQYVNV